MGNCCKCTSSKRSRDDDDDFTNLDGIDNGGNRKHKKDSKKKSSAPSRSSEEVHFEYDENTQRLVPIIKSHRHRRHNKDDDDKSLKSDDANSVASKKRKKSRRRGVASSTGRSGASLSDNVSDAGSRLTGGDGGRDEESLVDCMSNASFDIALDDNTMMRFEDQNQSNANNFNASSAGLLNKSGITPTTKDGENNVNTNNEDEEGEEGEDEDDEFTLEDLEELEEISRSEIYAAFMVAVQMLRFGMKKITPTVHYMLEGGSHGSSSNHGAGASATASGDENKKNDNTAMSPLSPGDDSSEFVPSTTTVIQMMKMKKKKKKATKKKNKKPSAATSGGDENNNTKKPGETDAANNKKNGNDAAAASSSSDEEEEDEEDENNAVVPVPGGGVARKPHRVQLLELDARNIAHDGSKVKSQYLDSKWDFFNSSTGMAEVSARNLSNGLALYGFKCFTGDTATPDDIRLISPFSNLSSFPNEVEDNNVPHIDFSDKKQMKKYTIIISKAMYLIPGLTKEDITPEYYASREYCEACIANVSKFEDCTDPSTFRMHKILVRFIFSLVVQLKITEITDPAIIRSMAQVDGFLPCKALLYERTKRDKMKTDMTVKVKSVLLFQEVPGGMLVSNVAAVYNSSIPGIIAAIVNNFGGNGASETEEVASRTRKHVWKKFVEPRLKNNK